MEKDVALMEKVAAVEAKVATHDVKIDNQEKRLSAVETETKDIHRIATAIELISKDTASNNAALLEMKAETREQISDLKDGQGRIEERVTNIEKEPDRKAASKFEQIKSDIWKILIAAAVGYLIAQAFPFLKG